MAAALLVISVDNPMGRGRWSKVLEHLRDECEHEELGVRLNLFDGVQLGAHENARINGCAESHKRCAALCTERGEEWTVCEDDVRLPGKRAALECWSRHLVPLARRLGADVIFAGVSAARVKAGARPIEVLDCECEQRHWLVPLEFMSGFFMYHTLTERARDVIRTAPRNQNIDNYFGGQIGARQLRAYCVYPFVARCRAGMSMIRERYQDYSDFFRRAETEVGRAMDKKQ